MNDSSDADAIRRIAAACAATEGCVSRIEKRLWEQVTRLEQVGIDKAIRLGDPAIWKAAVAGLRNNDS